MKKKSGLKSAKKSNNKDKLPRRGIAIKIISVFTLLGIIFGIYLLGFKSSIQEPVFYKINNGATISYVANDLKSQNLIESITLFKVSVLFGGNKIKAGVYELNSGASIFRISKMFGRGDVASTDVLLTEGLTVKQIKKLLDKNTSLSGNLNCITTFKDGDLFPDTYNVPIGTEKCAVLTMSHKKMESIRLGWNASGKPMPNPLSDWNQVITLASIIQKETPQASEMPIVASVYLNRLRKNMKLQADPTVVYAITDGFGDMGGRGLFTGHLKTRSPYNTYLNTGLPPAPIANVGSSAIAAVLNPADTNYLFFVADGQGGHKFARTYLEHQKNHADWRVIKKSLNASK